MLVLTGLVAVCLSTGCKRLSRQGQPCVSTDNCALGLDCYADHCHRPTDQMAAALPFTVRGLEMRKVAPKSKGELPPYLIELARGIGGPIKVDLYTSRTLPDLVKPPGGQGEFAAKEAAKRLGLTVAALAKEVEGFSLGRKVRGSEADAQQLGLQAVRGETGVPIVVAAVLRAGPRREVVPVVRGPEMVDHALASAFWRLSSRARGPLKIGLICAGGAFCPRVDPQPSPPAGGTWPETIALSLRAVYDPFDQVRVEVLRELREAGLEGVPVFPGRPVPADVNVFILLGAIQPVDGNVVSWLEEQSSKGSGVIIAAPGARFVASSGRLSVVEYGESKLLNGLGIRHADQLLVDRAGLTPYRVPSRTGNPEAGLPLVAEIARTDGLHDAIAGLTGLSLPLTGSFELTDESRSTPIAWSRNAVSNATLPADGTTAGLNDAAPPQAAGRPRVLAVAAGGRREGRTVAVASGLGVVSMSAAQLIEKLDLNPEGKDADLTRRLSPYALAARSYRNTHRANRSVRLGTFRLLERLAYWVSAPEAIRLLEP